MSETLKLPGLVDTHVHLREPGATHKEDFETGTRAAVAGGFTKIVDMPNNPIPTISSEALQEKIDLAAGRIYCDVGFHFGATADNCEAFETVKRSVFGLKIYMNHTTGNLLVDNDSNLERIFQMWPKTDAGPILVHAEGASLEKAIHLAREYDQRLHACHVSRADEIALIRAAKEAGQEITSEVTPHHLYLTEAAADPAFFGPFALMRPPLATEADVQALWEGIDSGVVDMIASDHAPHTDSEKRSANPPFGIIGLETTLPLMLTAVAEGRITLERLIELISTNPKRIFHIEDTPETYTEVDLKEEYSLGLKDFYSKANHSPFRFRRVTGRVKRVVLRGQVVYDGENVVGEPSGKVVYPDNNYE